MSLTEVQEQMIDTQRDFIATLERRVKIVEQENKELRGVLVLNCLQGAISGRPEKGGATEQN